MENNKYMEEKILEQVVRDISLFNIRKEMEKKQERDNTNQECFLKRVAVFLLSLLVISGTSFATYYYFKNIHTNQYTKRVIKPFLKHICGIYKNFNLSEESNSFDFKNPSSQNPTSNVL